MSTFLRDDALFAAIAAGDLPAVGNNNFVYVYLNGNQTGVAAGAFAKVQFNTKQFDPDGVFDVTTNFRYQPNIAGKFAVACNVGITPPANAVLSCALYRNGALYLVGQQNNTPSGFSQCPFTAVVSMNGSNDYLEFMGFHNAGTPGLFNGAYYSTWFTAMRIGP